MIASARVICEKPPASFSASVDCVRVRDMRLLVRYRIMRRWRIACPSMLAQITIKLTETAVENWATLQALCADFLIRIDSQITTPS